MIKVAGKEIKYNELTVDYAERSIERDILKTLSESDKEFRYDSMGELTFETDLRKRIIDASIALYRGRLRFRTFRESECNEAYWDRMGNGGFRLRSGVKPSAGIRDIFRHTSRYATECATAIMMVFYKAVLDIFKDDLFDSTFPEIVLMNWLYSENKMGVATYRNPDVLLAGDCRYFKNPDVDPATPEWQGENAIDLGDGTFYGHGLGIRNAEGIIRALNRNRIPGSEISAYLMKSATRPDFKRLYRVYGAAPVPATVT